MFKTRLPQHSPHHLCDSVNSSVSAIHSPLIKRILGDLKWVFIVLVFSPVKIQHLVVSLLIKLITHSLQVYRPICNSRSCR